MMDGQNLTSMTEILCPDDEKACKDVPGATVTIDKGSENETERDCARIRGDDCYDNLGFSGSGSRDEALVEIVTKCRNTCAGTLFKGMGKSFDDLVAKGVLKVVEDNGEYRKVAELTCTAGEIDGGKPKECDAEKKRKWKDMFGKKMAIQGDVGAACKQFAEQVEGPKDLQRLNFICTCMESFTEEEMRPFKDCMMDGQNLTSMTEILCPDDGKACEDVPGATVIIDKGGPERDCARIRGDDCYDNIGFSGSGSRDDEMLLEIVTKCRNTCAGTLFKGMGKSFGDLVAKGVLKVVEDNGEYGKIAELTCPVAMKKLKFKQTVKGITKEQCAGVRAAIRRGTAKQLKIAEEGVTVKEEGAGICVDGSRRRLAARSQAFAVEAEVEASKVEEAKKTVASDEFQAAIVSEAAQGGVKDLKTEPVEANTIEVDEVEDEKDGIFAFGMIVFGVFALLL